MEKVNEVGRFKQRNVNGIDSFNDWLDLNSDLELLHPQRFNYVVRKENLSMFLNYVGYLTIPELGVRDSEVKVTEHRRELCRIYLAISGKKEDICSVDAVLERLCVELKK